MKKSIWMVFILILMTSLAACNGSSEHSVHKGIYQRYSNLTSFYSEAKVTVFSRNTKSVYHVRQFFKAPDNFALFIDSPEEVAGSGYILKDGKFTLNSGFGQNQNADILFPEEKNTLFLCDFFEEYYKSEESAEKVTSAPLDKSTTLTCFIPNGKKDRFVQNLKIDNKTFLPIELITYDIDQNPVVMLEFNDFKRNCDIDQRIFN